MAVKGVSGFNPVMKGMVEGAILKRGELVNLKKFPRVTHAFFFATPHALKTLDRDVPLLQRLEAHFEKNLVLSKELKDALQAKNLSVLETNGFRPMYALSGFSDPESALMRTIFADISSRTLSEPRIGKRADECFMPNVTSNDVDVTESMVEALRLKLPDKRLAYNNVDEVKVQDSATGTPKVENKPSGFKALIISRAQADNPEELAELLALYLPLPGEVVITGRGPGRYTVRP